MREHPLSDLAPDWPLLSPLLDEALALTAPERPGWLAALAGRADVPASVKARLVMLLAAPGGIETAGFAGTLPRLGGVEGSPLAAGTRLGPWWLLEPLGAGGMGQVFLAERAEGGLQRRVALKLPRLAWSADLAARLARERDILATLEHPGIARLYEAGVASGAESPDGEPHPWLALEYVQGEPIDRWCEQRGCDRQARVALLEAVMQAVAYAHGRLVLHRDLKPSNILVDTQGRPRLLDFGIARLIEPEGTSAQDATRTLAAFTPAYASPEQALGQPLGTTSDVFALGVLAHRLLLGSLPHDDVRSRLRPLAAGAPAAGAAGVGAQEAGSALAADAAARLDRDLGAVLAKALAWDPRERYASVAAFAADLQAWRLSRPVQARRATLAYRAGRFVRRHRAGVAAGALAALLLAGAVAMAVLAGQREAEASRQAAAINRFLVGLFERADPDLRAGRDATARELLAQGEADILALPAPAQRQVLGTVAQLWLRFGDLQRAASAQERLSALLAAAPDRAARAALAASRLHQARIAFLAEQREAATRWLDEARALGIERSGTAAERALAHETAGWLALHGRTPASLEAALASFRQAGAVAAAVVPGEPEAAARAERVLMSLQGEAWALSLLGRSAEADAVQAAQLARLDTDPGLTPLQRVSTVAGIAMERFAAGRYAEGAPPAERMLAEAVRAFGPDPAAALRLRETWLRYQLALGQGERARAWLRESGPSEAELARQGAEIAFYWPLLAARLHAAGGDGPAARAALAQAGRAHRALAATPGHAIEPLTRALQLATAEVHLELGAPAAALQALEPVTDRDSARPDLLRGVAWARLGRSDPALRALDVAEDSAHRAGEPPATRALIGLNRALVRAAQAGPDDARAALQALAAAEPELLRAWGDAGPVVLARDAVRRRVAAASARPDGTEADRMLF